MEIKRGNGWLHFELSGEIDLVWWESHRPGIEMALEDCPPLVVIDVENVSFMDSTGLSLLVLAYRQCQPPDGEVYVLHPLPLVARTIGIAGVDQAVTVVTSADEVRQIHDRLAQLDSSDTANQGVSVLSTDQARLAHRPG